MDEVEDDNLHSTYLCIQLDRDILTGEQLPKTRPVTLKLTRKEVYSLIPVIAASDNNGVFDIAAQTVKKKLSRFFECVALRRRFVRLMHQRYVRGPPSTKTHPTYDRRWILWVLKKAGLEVAPLRKLVYDHCEFITVIETEFGWHYNHRISKFLP